jgi:hypothetical protein
MHRRSLRDAVLATHLDIGASKPTQRCEGRFVR